VDSTFIIDTAKDAKNGIYMNTGPIDTSSSDADLYVGGGDYSSLYAPSTDTPQIIISPGSDYVSYEVEDFGFGTLTFNTDGSLNEGYFAALSYNNFTTQQALIATSMRGLGLPEYLFNQLYNMIYQISD
jgi:hypothetical protein